MTYKYKALFRRCILIIISAILIFCCFSMVATKIVYDSIFTRFDGQGYVPAELDKMVSGRQQFYYPSNDNMISGYLYRSDTADPKDTLVVLAPGFEAGADSYLWQISSLLDMGWSVFAFDATGCYSSEGDSSVGFAQEIIDLKSTISHIENNNRFGYNKIAIIGHSRGGYAACCVLNLEYDIAAVVSVGGVNSAMEGIMCSATDYIGPLAYGNYGFLWIYQASLFGAHTLNLSCDEEIEQSKIPVLIVHGASDEKIPLERYSIISYKDSISSDNAEFLIWDEPNQDGHTNLLFDPNGKANKELMNKINDFLTKSIY